MTNVPVGPNRVNPSGQAAEDASKEPWRDSVAASSRNAGNSFKASDNKTTAKKGFSKVKLIAIAIALLLVFALFAFWSARQANPAGLIDTSKYQAVFFTNGQVYFGKLSSVGGDYYKLTQIYYIQAKETPVAPADSDNPQATDDAQQLANPELVKLGGEIHGPEDAMIINRDQVLFFENLKKDSKVTDVINKDRAAKH